MSKRKICVVTGTRAEYGLLKNLIFAIKDDIDLELQLIVTGSHLSANFGNTYQEIEKDFVITKKIPIDLSDDTHIATSIAMANLQIDISKTLKELLPDIVVVLGDRYEIFAVATACMMLNIPIAHIHGGESSQGAIDEAIRHSITKMSHIHLCATDVYKKRIIQLGEHPSTVHNVGALGVENIAKIKLLTKDEFEHSINFKLNKKNLLVTFHPTTLENTSSSSQFKELLDALDTLKDTNIIFTESNADTGGAEINNMLEKYVSNHKTSSKHYKSLGQLRYLSAMQFVDAVVGNSSSGIIEAPSFKIATINIGDRQKGRQEAKSIINTKVNKNAILKSIDKIYTDDFKKILKESTNPYHSENTAKKIKELLKRTKLENILKKSFYDLDNKKENVLVISVHPDDETLGCGGTLLKHKNSGDKIHWMICTKVHNNPEFLAQRENELKEVSEKYQFDSVHNLELETMRVDEYTMSELISKISKVIQDVKPNILYLPFKSDVHSDHRKIFEASFACTKSFRYTFIDKIYMMETLSETEFAPAIKKDSFVPNLFVDISEFINKKIEIMKIYKGEMAEHPFPRSEKNIKALATIRGASSGCEYAESFMILKEIQKG